VDYPMAVGADKSEVVNVSFVAFDKLFVGKL